MARTDELMWIPGCMDDIESDLSRFHRVDDWTQLSGPRFLLLVERLPVYGGCVAATFARAMQDTDGVPSVTEPVVNDGPALAAMTAEAHAMGMPGIEYVGG